MGYLLAGVISGAFCAIVAAWLGAPWWALILTYSATGTIATLANALWHALRAGDPAAPPAPALPGRGHRAE